MHEDERPIPVELTGKRWKAQILASALVAFAGVGLFVLGVSLPDRPVLNHRDAYHRSASGDIRLLIPDVLRWPRLARLRSRHGLVASRLIPLCGHGCRSPQIPLGVNLRRVY